MSTRILQGDVLDRLAELPDASAHCVVTSPPRTLARRLNARPLGTGVRLTAAATAALRA